jgi:hypothetical protein
MVDDVKKPKAGGHMKNRTRLILAGLVALVALAVGGAAIAGGVGPFGDDAQLKGPNADKASAAALRITGGGKVNAVERDSEKGAVYEVEVTRPDGKTVDVRLNGSFGKVAVDGDTEEGGAEDGGPDNKGPGHTDDD